MEPERPQMTKRRRAACWISKGTPAQAHASAHAPTLIRTTSRRVSGSIISGVTGVFFSVATDGSMCPGVDLASKNEYQDTPGGKDGRCIRVTILPPSQCRKSRKSGALKLPVPLGPPRPVEGHLYLYPFYYYCATETEESADNTDDPGQLQLKAGSH
jgi:hypothetical protein